MVSIVSSELSAEQQASLQIQTGADVIKFYRKSDGSSSVHFFQCNRASPTKRYRPYDLLVAGNENLDRQEYFHVSASGVTRIVDGRWSEYVPLDVWDEEARQFDRLCQLHFFETFIIGRFFHKWRKVIVVCTLQAQAIRRLKFERLRRRIAERAFHSKPEFLSGLQNIAEAAVKLTGVPLITLPTLGKQYEVDRWADLQISSREQHMKPALDAIIETARQEVEGVCRLVGRRAREWAQSVRTVEELADETGVDVLRGHRRPMIVIKAEKQDRARMFRLVMDEALLMGNFVRLADIMLTEALSSHVIGTVKQLLEALQAPEDVLEADHTGTFITTVSFAPEGGIRCCPDGFSVVDTIMTNAVEGTIALVATCPRLILTRSFVPFYETQPSGLNLSNTIRDAEEFKRACSDTEQLIISNFASARDRAGSLEQCKPIFDFCSAISDQLTLTRTKADVEDLLQQLTGWHSSLSGVSEGFGEGCLYVDTAPLKGLVMPAVSRSIDVLKAHTVVLARSACSESLSDIRARISRLSIRSQDAHALSSLQAICRLQRDQCAAVLSQIDDIDGLYNLMTLHEHRAPMADQVKHDDLKEARLLYMQALEDAKAYLM